MKNKKWLCGVGTLTICFMLTGCGHEHTWMEATCTAPKTCSECGETEGEALGHTWVDATCAEPKTCSVCGETEGETLAHTWVDATCAKAKHCSVCGETEGNALEHTLTEANYQQAATCEVCEAIVGEPLQADFEKYGLVCNAAENIEYSIMVSMDGFSLQQGKITFSDYEIFDSDDTHEALEGYEWRAITMTESFNETDAIVYNDVGFVPVPTFTDYYCNFANTYNESTDTYTLNYNGVDYTDVKSDSKFLQGDWNGDTFTLQARYFYRVPIGYDGLVATVADNSMLDDRDLLVDTSQIHYDKNPRFRLK